MVAAVGQDVRSLAAGDQVLTHPVPLRHQGAGAQWLLAPAALVARKPAVVGGRPGAAFPVPALTADQALTQAAPAPVGQWVLVHGAGGVTGGLAVQLAVALRSDRGRHGGPLECGAGPRLGARASWSTITTGSGRPACGTHLRAGGGVGAAVNAAPGGAAAALQTGRAGGRLATITGDPPPPERGVEVTDVYVRADGARLAGAGRDASRKGQLSLHVAATRPLAEAATALQDAVAGRVAGASVLILQRSPL